MSGRKPLPNLLLSILSALDVLSRANVDNRSLPRSVWQDMGAIKGRCEFGSNTLNNTPGQ